jgi:hypothetical protein
LELQKIYAKNNQIGGSLDTNSTMAGLDKPIAEEMIESDKESELDDGESDQDNADEKLESLAIANAVSTPTV